MNTLKSVNFNENKISLYGNLVESDILPTVAKELGRDVSVDGETVVNGAIYARNLYITAGPFSVSGAVFAQGEIHIKPDAKGRILFKKAVGCTGTIAALIAGGRATFLGDISSKKISLRNCFVSGSLMADEIDIEDCVVLGGAFAMNKLSVRRSVIGTFNAPEVLLAGSVYLTMPSAYSVESVSALPDLELWNLTTTDLAALYFGKTEKEDSGKIRMDPKGDCVEVQLTDSKGNRQTIRSLSVAGKVMMADILEMGELRNHFILKAGALAGHLSKTFRLEEGELQQEKVENLFFDMLSGTVNAKVLTKTVGFEELVERYS